MARETIYETHTKEFQVPVDYKVSCDLCGYAEDKTMIFEVRVEVGADDCVGARITRDVCQGCYDNRLGRFFDPLFVSLEAGEEKHDYRIENEDDRWYG